MSNITVRVDEQRKQLARQIFENHGLTTSDAILLFLDTVIRKGAVTFNATISKRPTGQVVHRILDTDSEPQSVGTRLLAQSLVAFQLKRAFRTKVTRVSGNPVVDLQFTVGGQKYACAVKGRQFSQNESLQDKLRVSEVEELKRFAQREDCIPRIAFVMIDPEGTEGNVYIFDPADLDDLSKACVAGITGSLEREGEIRLSNARRNRVALQNHDRILSFGFNLGIPGSFERHPLFD